MTPYLVALGDGPNLVLDKPILLVGRHQECDVQIPSRKISRKHCCIAQVAAVCRNTCGVILLVSSPAAFAAAANPLRTDRTGLPFHSTMACLAMPSRCQRRL